MDAPPHPKRRNAAETRARILTAAQDAFAERGYASVGIRDIAKRAGIASSLLMRYFGSKAALFEEALVDALYQRGRFTQDRANFGQAMARLLTEGTDDTVIAMIALATGDPEAREITQRVANQHMIDGLIEWLGPPNARARALSMIAVMTGFVVNKYQLYAGSTPEELVRWLARTLQELIDGDGQTALEVAARNPAPPAGSA